MVGQIAALTNLNRDSVNRYLRLIYQAIAKHCKYESPLASDIGLNESCFGVYSACGKSRRGTKGKTIFFDIYKKVDMLLNTEASWCCTFDLITCISVTGFVLANSISR